MTTLPSLAHTPPVWTLELCRCAHLEPPSIYLYLLVEAPRNLPLAAALTEGPMGATSARARRPCVATGIARRLSDLASLRPLCPSPWSLFFRA